MTTPNYPTLIALINSKPKDANMKFKPTDEKPIQIRSVHHHPSKDLVLYTTTFQQANALRDQGEKWIHTLSSQLKLHHPVYTVVVHGIPASFQPADQQHLNMLKAMNQEKMSPAPLFVKWISPNSIQRGFSHSSIRIGFTDAKQAKQDIKQQIFYGRYNKETEYGRKSKPRGMNCLHEGHTSNHCNTPLMCPYCAEAHPVDKCELRGCMTSNFTSCAIALKAKQGEGDLKTLFSTTLMNLLHSQLAPRAPPRWHRRRLKQQTQQQPQRQCLRLGRQPP